MPEEEHSLIHPALRKAKVFTGLSDEDLREVSQRLTRRRFNREEFLFLEGQPAEIFHIILEGQVKILQTTVEGFDVILHVLGPGELIGALPTIGEAAYPASAQGLSPGLVASLTAETFDDLIQRHPSVAGNLLRFATAVIQSSHRKLQELATKRVEQRIARTLSRLARQIGKEEQGEVVLDAPLTRRDLAAMTGTTIFTVSRTLKSWERQGILRVGREQVIILDPHRLVIIGEDLPDSDPGLQDI